MGIYEGSVLQRDLRGAGLDHDFRAAPLTALHLEILCAQLPGEARFLHGALHDRVQRGRTRDRHRYGLTRVEIRSQCHKLMQVVSIRLNLQVRVVADLTVYCERCRRNVEGGLAEGDDIPRAVVSHVNGSIDGNRAGGAIRPTVCSSPQTQVGMGADVPDAARPGHVGSTVELAQQSHRFEFRLANGLLRSLQRDAL